MTLEEAEAAYKDCLGADGVVIEDIPSGVDLDEVAQMVDATDEELAALGTTRAVVVAHSACWPSFLAAMETATAAPTEPADRALGPADPELAAKLREAVACLNERGWDFLEPGVESDALSMAPRDPQFDWDDPAFLDDQRECQELAGMMG